VVKLIQLGLNQNTQDENGDTPLHLSIKLKNISIFRLLLSTGSKINIQNNHKETPKMLFPKYFINENI
jgi:Arf-GAP/SH3 domain/ANK repeat/PH domain-containing protein